MRLKTRIAAVIIFCVSIIFNLLITSEIMAETINISSAEKIQPAISQALTNSNDIDYIYIPAGTFEEQIIIVIPSGQEIHLIGSGPDNTIISLPSGKTGNVISADGGGKIFIEGIKIINGTRSGIRINNSTELTIKNCKISNNIGNIGAGIYNYGATLNIINSTISNNNATLYGGGIYNDGTLTIINSKLTDNTSPGGQGGAIYNLGNSTVSNSSFSNNSAASYEGIASISGIPNITNIATSNWWGSVLGPYNAVNNPLGVGNSVADNVSFSPFLTSDPFIPIQPEDNLPPDEGNGSDDDPPPISGNESASKQGSSCFSLDHYLDSYGSPAKGFIALLYRSILGREPDIEGLNYWQEVLESNSNNASGIAGCLFFSEENIARIKELDNNDFIKYLYQGILFREYDVNSYEDWLSCMKSGATKQDLFDSFAASKEWSDICFKFGINP